MGGGQHVARIQHPTDKTWYRFCDHDQVSPEVDLTKLCKNNKNAVIIVYERDACPSLTWICARIVSKIYSSTSLPSTLPDDLVQFIKRVKHYWNTECMIYTYSIIEEHIFSLGGVHFEVQKMERCRRPWECVWPEHKEVVAQHLDQTSLYVLTC